MKVWKALLDIRCGIDSEIPACCIAWFIGPWKVLLRACWSPKKGSKNVWAHKVHLRYFQALQVRGFEHIGCPLCLLRSRPVVVRETPFPNDLLTKLLLKLDSV